MKKALLFLPAAVILAAGALVRVGLLPPLQPGASGATCYVAALAMAAAAGIVLPKR